MAERAAKQLELNKSELPNSITEVIATLSRAGFDAYIVGGGVRDTLLGLKPKDFDAVTDAKPHEIKDVFGKRCRIIGRRFQLAHVYSGRELIEVATFRGPPNNNANTNQDGMIIRDNVWGDIKQDFARRDFSINALYYQPLKGIVHDFCGALDDIRNKTIRLLGHAPVRIEEDPVRLLRALRFKAKLGFEFDKELSEQFHDDNWALLEQISPHRLYDETQKMFTGGYLVPLLPLLFESGAIDSLIIYPPSEPNALVQQVAINTDKRINAGKSINPAFFYAALLWENYLHQLEKAKKRNMPFVEAQMQAASKVIERQRIKTAIPKFAEQFIRDIWLLQPKLAAPRSKQIEQLAEHPRFRAGFDFLLLREQCGDAEHPLSESTNGMGDWWQTYQTLSEQQKQQAIDDFDENIRRGAYKQAKNANNGQRGRTRNRHIDADNEQVKHSHSNAQRAEHTNGIQPISDDESNIPAQRRRVTDAAASTEQPKARNGKKGQSTQKLTPREKHDNNELAQLQQLSLASHSAASSKTPAPLFVIEHESVVPPLHKQLSTDKAEPFKSVKDSSVEVVSTEADSTKAESTKAKPQKKIAPKKSAVDDQVNEQQCKEKQTVAKQESATAAATEVQIAQTPQLVSSNNAPIPHKRRRRQSSVDPKRVQVDVTTDTAEVDARSSAQYKKKTPKTVEPLRDEAKATKQIDKAKSVKSAKPTKNADAQVQVEAKKPAKTSKANHGKTASSTVALSNGAVPAKRRRRQPSTDEA